MAPRATARRRLAVDRQQLVILLVAAVMIGSFVLLVLWPKQQELTALGSAVSRERGLVKQKVLTSREGVYVTAYVAGLRKAQAHLARGLPTSPRLADYLEAVAQQLDAGDLASHEVQRGTKEQIGPVAAIPIHLRLVGVFEAVYRCLAGIEGLERLSRVRRLSLRRGETEGHVEAEAEILVYHMPPTETSRADDPAGRGRPKPQVVGG